MARDLKLSQKSRPSSSPSEDTVPGVSPVFALRFESFISLGVFSAEALLLLGVVPPEALLVFLFFFFFRFLPKLPCTGGEGFSSLLRSAALVESEEPS